MKKYSYAFLITFLLFSCVTKQSGNSEKSPVDVLFEQLKSVGNKGILFGHQDDLAYGVTWAYVEGRSDTKEAAGDYPALFGWELGGIELGHKLN